MKIRLIINATYFFLLPTITITWDKIWYGNREIAIAWLKWYLCFEWGHEY